MSFKVSQKGSIFFVEDTAAGKIVERFKDRYMAEKFAKEAAAKQSDYFKDVKSNITINSVDMNI